MTTLNLQVSSSTDDGYWYPASAFSATAARVYVGDAFYLNPRGWARFQSVTIASGSTVSSATLTFCAGASDSGTTCNAIFYANDEDSATAPTSYADGEGKSLTTASVAWASVPAWTADSNYSPPDVSALVQEVIDRGGWSSGQNLMLIVKNNSSSSGAGRKAYTYNDTPSKAPKLDIDYTAGGGGGGLLPRLGLMGVG